MQLNSDCIKNKNIVMMANTTEKLPMELDKKITPDETSRQPFDTFDMLGARDTS